MTSNNLKYCLFIFVYLLAGINIHLQAQPDKVPNVSVSGIILSDEEKIKSFKIYGPTGIVHTALAEELAHSQYRFKFEFHVMEFQYVRLYIRAGIYTRVLELYLEPNYQLDLTGNMDNIYQSVVFRGKGYEANTFLHTYNSKFQKNKLQVSYQIPTGMDTEIAVGNYLRKYKDQEMDFLESHQAQLPQTFYQRQKYNILYKFENEKVRHFKFKIEYEKLSHSFTMVEIPKNSPLNYQVYLVPNYEKYVKHVHEFSYCENYAESSSPTELFNCYQRMYGDFTRIWLQYHLIYKLLQGADFRLGEKLYFKYIQHYENILPPEEGRNYDLARTYYVLIERLRGFYEEARAWQEGYLMHPLFLWNTQDEMFCWYHPDPKRDARENRNYQLLFFKKRGSSSNFTSKEQALDIFDYVSRLRKIADQYHKLDLTFISIDDVFWQFENDSIKPLGYMIKSDKLPLPAYKNTKSPVNSVLLVAPDGTIIAKNPAPEDLEEMLDLGILDRLPPLVYNFINLFIILFFLSIGAIIAIIVHRVRLHYIRKKEAQKRRITELELKAIRSQLNPHFLFNSMSSIQSLISSENPEIASEHLAGLADLMRMVLKHSEKGIISLAEELEAAEKYCQLEALRFNFTYEIDIAPEIDPYLIEVPAMIIQPYIENAILHGISNCMGPCWIRIEASRLHQSLLIVVEDNGIGLMQAEARGSSGNGMGMKLNRERLSLLHHKAGSVQVFDKSELGKGERGTRIEIWLPVEER